MTVALIFSKIGNFIENRQIFIHAFKLQLRKAGYVLKIFKYSEGGAIFLWTWAQPLGVVGIRTPKNLDGPHKFSRRLDEHYDYATDCTKWGRPNFFL